ncbi:unnamed protein product, partial [Mesorhabditis belari]|uniref:Uncharacterized protein n=1 Tax=Mesorhabditis belari TaxID=2138241 RepID=A0AAF3EB32_9BILA
MSIDQEIDNIRKALEDVHRTLSYVNNGTDDALLTLNKTLQQFEDRLFSVVEDITAIGQQVVTVTKEFPHSYVYMSLFLVLMLLLWLLIVYMGFTAHSHYKEVRIVMRKLRNEYYRKKYDPVDQRRDIDDFFPETLIAMGESPPPSYESKISSGYSEEMNEEIAPMIVSDH